MQPTRAIHWLTAVGMFVAMGMLALGVAILVDTRADAWRNAEQASHNLVLALTRDVERNITLYDLSLQGVIEALARPDIDRISPETRQMALFGRASAAEYLGVMIVLNQNGDLVASSKPLPPSGKTNFRDREHFSIHQQRSDVGLFISRPFKSPIRAGDASIAISRRISAPDGSFAGVTVGGLRLAYFQDLFSTLDLGSGGTVTLFRYDGFIIARRPYSESEADVDLSKSPTFRAYTESAAGTIVAKSLLDGVERLYSFRHVPNLPLVMSVAVPVDTIYATWWWNAVPVGLVLIVLCAATVTLCLLFQREILRRIFAEGELRAAAGKLLVAAATDGLTGLGNRRSFDERLTQEWKRSIRAQTPIGLLMIDADSFKMYNDRYGHVEGDQVLRSIADCIARHLVRPGDFGARYGGEEFAVVLPETEEAGAVTVAERIRVAVSELNIAHAGSPMGHVTVSIGLAVFLPVIADVPTLVVEHADAALYEAKRLGRNRVHTPDLRTILPVMEPVSPLQAV